MIEIMAHMKEVSQPFCGKTKKNTKILTIGCLRSDIRKGDLPNMKQTWQPLNTKFRIKLTATQKDRESLPISSVTSIQLSHKSDPSSLNNSSLPQFFSANLFYLDTESTQWQNPQIGGNIAMRRTGGDEKRTETFMP
jgi:hypothetical protein